MFEADASTSSFDVKPAPPERHSGERKLHLLAAFLSALLPGGGQLLLGQLRKGILLLATLFVLCLSCWPLRLPRVYLGFALPVFVWMALFCYASCSALVAACPLTLPRPSKWWLLGLVPLSLFLGVLFDGLGFRAAGFRNFTVPSTSMEPTIVQGDGIVVDTRCYNTNVPSREDVIIFHKEKLFVIKRVIGVNGDTIEGRDREILLNGSVLNESYIEHTQRLGSNPLLDSFGPVKVPNGSYFVMGDNRDVSLDSRYPGYGLIDTRSIVGRPLYIYKSAADRIGKTVR